MKEPGFGERLKQSFGFLPTQALQNVAKQQCLWIHAASVGEIVAASPIVKEMRAAFPLRRILVSTVTATGHEMAKKIMPDADSIIYFPLDLPWLCASVVKRIEPVLFVLVETELWPNFLQAMGKNSIPVLMVNGRIGDKNRKKYRYLFSLLTEMLQSVSLFCMQSSLDASYIITMGALPEKVVVTGNTKFDQTYTVVTPLEKQHLLANLGYNEENDFLFIAGSTHEGEEEQIFEAYLLAKQSVPALKLMIAPRDIRRTVEVMKIAEGYSLFPVRRTEIPGKTGDVVLLDTIGELGRLYSLGNIIFVGGSLIQRGGHNILEPAAHGKPILVGPHMFNFKESYALLQGRGACITVHDSKELAERIVFLVQDQEAAKTMGRCAAEIMRENSGAARKSVEYMRRYVQ